MMVHAAVVALSAFVVVTHAYNFNSLARIARASNAIRAEAPASRVAISKQSSWVKLFATVEEPEVDTPAPMGGDDFLQYAVGQQYDAVVTNAKNYGVFAKITSTGFSVLLPRMKMSPQNFAKLKGAVEAKSEDPVRIEILNVDSENRTLSAKYIPSSGSQDIAKLKDMNLKAETFEATVVSAHDFGVFAKLDKEDFEGLIPASKLPDSMPQGTIKESYPAGTKVTVKVLNFNDDGSKLTFTMRMDGGSSGGAAAEMDGISQETYREGVIQKVFNYGFLVRPAGLDAVGLVHYSRVPRELTNILKRRANIDFSKKEQSDIEALFSPGDVVKVRLHSVNEENGRVEYAMTPFKAAADDEEDDYIVEGRDTEEELERMEKEKRFNRDEERFDMDSLMVWWRGEPYVKKDFVREQDEDFAVVGESARITEGSWRRMFDSDLRKEESDYAAKVMEIEAKELADEIGELAGMDDDMMEGQQLGFGTFPPNRKVGSFVSASQIPDSWKSEMTFFKDAEAVDSARQEILKAGKAGEEAERTAVMAEMEKDIMASAASRKNRASEGDFPAELEVGPEEPAAAAPAAVMSEPEAASEEPAAEAEAPAAEEPAAE